MGGLPLEQFRWSPAQSVATSPGRAGPAGARSPGHGSTESGLARAEPGGPPTRFVVRRGADSPIEGFGHADGHATGIDAPVTVKGVDPNGSMQNPNGPEDVVWYDFTARPGQGGNAVFSGHLDYHDYGPAVFARLREVAAGDLVEVRLEDGTVQRYVVTMSVLYPADSAPSQEIVGPTGREMVTLVTCGGTWQGRPQGYSHRLVVRADHL
jgi:LPXTG-site transpeptidase (sortase) family protein